MTSKYLTLGEITIGVSGFGEEHGHLDIYWHHKDDEHPALFDRLHLSHKMELDTVEESLDAALMGFASALTKLGDPQKHPGYMLPAMLFTVMAIIIHDPEPLFDYLESRDEDYLQTLHSKVALRTTQRQLHERMAEAFGEA